MNEAVESVLDPLKAELEALQAALNPLRPSAEGGDEAPSADFLHRVEASLQTQKNALTTLEFELERAELRRAQQQEQRDRQSAGLLSELEAQIEAELQQVRLLQAAHGRQQQFRQDEQSTLQAQIERLKTELHDQETRLRQQEAEALKSRTWAISLNLQRQTAQQTAQQLRSVIEQKRSQLQAQAETVAAQTAALEEQQALSLAQTKLVTDLRRDLATAHRTIEALEQQVMHRSRQQMGVVQLRQESALIHRQEEEQRRALEEQLRQNQSQLLAQAEELRQLGQSVQDWRRRSLAYQHHLQNIRDWVEQHSEIALPAALAELMGAPIPELFPNAHRRTNGANPIEEKVTSISSKANSDTDTLDLPRFPH